MPFCIKCGTKLSDEAVFCSNCGYKVEPVGGAHQQVSSAPVPSAAQSQTAYRPTSSTAPSQTAYRPTSSAAAQAAFREVNQSAPADAPVQSSQAAAPSSSSGRFKDYITKIAARLNVQVEYSSIFDAYCFHRKEFQAMAMSNYRYYFFIRHDDGMDGTQFRQFADRCFEDVWNKPHQSGVAANQMVIPFLCQDHVNQQTIGCLSKSIKQKHTFASGMIGYPVILELSSGKMFFPTETPVYGCAVWPKLKKMCAETMYYYV